MQALTSSKLYTEALLVQRIQLKMHIIHYIWYGILSITYGMVHTGVPSPWNMKCDVTGKCDIGTCRLEYCT